jgi:hypothetical protein
MYFVARILFQNPEEHLFQEINEDMRSEKQNEPI